MNEAAIRAVIEPVLARHGLELDRLDIVPAGSRSVVRVTVDGDGPKGRGPLLDDIASASRDISEALDEAPTGNRPYTLEVSSRGTSSPLTEPKHYRRNTGRLVHIVRTDGQVVDGRITGIDDDGTPAVLLDNGQRVALDEVRKATIKVELNRPADPELDDDLTDGDDSDDDDSDGDSDDADDDEEEQR